MAAIVETRKRCAAAFLDEPSPAPPHLSKRCRVTPCAGSMAPAPSTSLVFNPLDALRHIFPDADQRGLEACFAASGRDLHATVQAYHAHQAKDELAFRFAHAAGDDECCAGLLLEQMAAATNVPDVKNRATWMLGVIRNAGAERAVREVVTELARLREENAALREQAERGATEGATLREENAALAQRAAAAERDGSVLKRGVIVQQRRYEETERAAAAMKEKVAELEMANYALGVRLRDAEASRFPAAYRGSVAPTCSSLLGLV